MPRHYNIKPIPTRYKSIVFRSKLEAKWACFFDLMNYSWKYEPATYYIPRVGGYIPDFTINGRFFEIKPTYPTPTEIYKMRVLCRITSREGFILFGSVAPPWINWLNLNKSIKMLTHAKVLKNISGALLLHFNKDGDMCPYYKAFVGSGVWAFCLNPEKKGDKLALCAPGSEELTQTIYRESAVSYDGGLLGEAYRKAGEKFRKKG